MKYLDKDCEEVLQIISDLQKTGLIVTEHEINIATKGKYFSAPNDLNVLFRILGHLLSNGYIFRVEYVNSLTVAQSIPPHYIVLQDGENYKSDKRKDIISRNIPIIISVISLIVSFISLFNSGNS